jgi:hypothetical protein
MTIAIIIAAFVAGAAGALAYGYRGQLAQAKEQIGYLRQQLATARGETRQAERPNLPAVVSGQR